MFAPRVRRGKISAHVTTDYTFDWLVGCFQTKASRFGQTASVSLYHVTRFFLNVSFTVSYIYTKMVVSCFIFGIVFTCILPNWKERKPKSDRPFTVSRKRDSEIPDSFSCRHETLSGMLWTATARNRNKSFTHIANRSTSCRGGWPRGFGALNPSPHYWILTTLSVFSSATVPVHTPPKCVAASPCYRNRAETTVLVSTEALSGMAFVPAQKLPGYSANHCRLY